jgi:hypothetical protein
MTQLFDKSLHRHTRISIQKIRDMRLLLSFAFFCTLLLGIDGTLFESSDVSPAVKDYGRMRSLKRQSGTSFGNFRGAQGQSQPFRGTLTGNYDELRENNNLPFVQDRVINVFGMGFDIQLSDTTTRDLRGPISRALGLFRAAPRFDDRLQRNIQSAIALSFNSIRGNRGPSATVSTVQSGLSVTVATQFFSRNQVNVQSVWGGTAQEFMARRLYAHVRSINLIPDMQLTLTFRLANSQIPVMAITIAFTTGRNSAQRLDLSTNNA